MVLYIWCGDFLLLLNTLEILYDDKGFIQISWAGTLFCAINRLQRFQGLHTPNRGPELAESNQNFMARGYDTSLMGLLSLSLMEISVMPTLQELCSLASTFMVSLFDSCIHPCKGNITVLDLPPWVRPIGLFAKNSN